MSDYGMGVALLLVVGAPLVAGWLVFRLQERASHHARVRRRLRALIDGS